MTAPTLMEIMDALAGQIDSVLGTAIPGIQIEPRLEPSMSASPCIDVFPADPFQEQTGFSLLSREMNFTVRTRVNTADHEAAQDVLLSLMDVRSASSLAAALLADTTLSGTVSQVSIPDGPTAYGQYPDSGPDVLGCQWTAKVVL